MKRSLCLALLLAAFTSAFAQSVAQRYPSDLTGVDLVLTQEPTPPSGYAAETHSSRRVIRIKYDMDVLDRTDLVFTSTNLILVHTTTSNAGMFIGSDVYELPFIGPHDVDKRLLMGKSDLLKILELGLAFHRAMP